MSQTDFCFLKIKFLRHFLAVHHLEKFTRGPRKSAEFVWVGCAFWAQVGGETFNFVASCVSSDKTKKIRTFSERQNPDDHT